MGAPTEKTADALGRFTYTLIRPGLARVGVHPRSQRGFLGPVFEITSRSDALGDLVRAVIALLRGAEHAQITWYGSDPGWGETIQFMRTGARLRIEITHVYPPRCHKTTEAPPHPPQVFETTLSSFAKRVYHLLSVLVQQWGIDGYRTMWPPYAFPLPEHQTLGELIPASTGQVDSPVAEP